MTKTARQRNRTTYLRDLLRALVYRDMQLRYKGSVLGLTWSLLNPLAQLLVFTFIFQLILPLNIPNYAGFLFSGLLAWSWFQTSLIASATSIVDGSSLIKRPGFPAAILPIVTVMSNLIHFLLALPVLLASLLITGVGIHWTMILVPLIVIVQFVFTLGLAYFIATFHVTFRDTQHLVGVFLMLMFYLTPIFYDSNVIPEQFQFVYRLNPILHFLEAYRAIFIAGTMPDMVPLLVITAVSAILLALGYLTFTRASYKFVEAL